MIRPKFDEEAERAVLYALDAFIPNDYYRGWKKALVAMREAAAKPTTTKERTK